MNSQTEISIQVQTHHQNHGQTLNQIPKQVQISVESHQSTRTPIRSKSTTSLSSKFSHPVLIYSTRAENSSDEIYSDSFQNLKARKEQNCKDSVEFSSRPPFEISNGTQFPRKENLTLTKKEILVRQSRSNSDDMIQYYFESQDEVLSSAILCDENHVLNSPPPPQNEPSRSGSLRRPPPSNPVMPASISHDLINSQSFYTNLVPSTTASLGGSNHLFHSSNQSEGRQDHVNPSGGCEGISFNSNRNSNSNSLQTYPAQFGGHSFLIPPTPILPEIFKTSNAQLSLKRTQSKYTLDLQESISRNILNSPNTPSSTPQLEGRVAPLLPINTQPNSTTVFASRILVHSGLLATSPPSPAGTVTPSPPSPSYTVVATNNGEEDWAPSKTFIIKGHEPHLPIDVIGSGLKNEGFFPQHSVWFPFAPFLNSDSRTLPTMNPIPFAPMVPFKTSDFPNQSFSPYPFSQHQRGQEESQVQSHIQGDAQSLGQGQPFTILNNGFFPPYPPRNRSALYSSQSLPKEPIFPSVNESNYHVERDPPPSRGFFWTFLTVYLCFPIQILFWGVAGLIAIFCCCQNPFQQQQQQEDQQVQRPVENPRSHYLYGLPNKANLHPMVISSHILEEGLR